MCAYSGANESIEPTGKYLYYPDLPKIYPARAVAYCVGMSASDPCLVQSRREDGLAIRQELQSAARRAAHAVGLNEEYQSATMTQLIRAPALGAPSSRSPRRLRSGDAGRHYPICNDVWSLNGGAAFEHRARAGRSYCRNLSQASATPSEQAILYKRTASTESRATPNPCSYKTAMLLQARATFPRQARS